MTEVRPLKGVLYNPEKIADIAAVVAPPYDMISPHEQKVLHERAEHNVVRLILGYQNPEDTETDNRYSRAAATLRAWLEMRILRRDAAPAIYRYDQEYSLGRGQRLKRSGFIALAGLEEPGEGSIHPHEKTLSGPKEDRLKLMLACRANLSQIFSFYDDPAGDVERIIERSLPSKPRFDFSDFAGVRHILWSVSDPEVHAGIGRLMADKALFIADGHHRYETALNLRRIMRERLGNACPTGYDYVMMYFANMSGTGLTILPFHRLVTVTGGLDVSRAVEGLRRTGRLTQVAADASPAESLGALRTAMAEGGPGEHLFGIYVPPAFYLLSSPRRPAGEADPVEDLDVSVLHHRIFPAALGKEAAHAQIAYLTAEEEILEQMRDGAYQMAFFLNPTRVEQVRDVASAGLRMPPKSTNFHPKLISGLVLNLLE